MIKKIFLDSGAFSLFTLKVKKNNYDYSFYETDEFWEYIDDYCQFIKLNKNKFSACVTVDVLFRPELSWKTFKYIQNKYGIKTLPVFHFPKLSQDSNFYFNGNFDQQQFKWLKKYLDNCEYIGLGGLGVDVTKRQYIPYADRVFKLICNGGKIPKWKVHGFAVTSHELIFRYPWYSVDSTTYQRQAAYGAVFCPPILKNKYKYNKQPSLICFSPLSASNPKFNNYTSHFDNPGFLNSIEKEKIKNYFEYIKPGTIIGNSEYKQKKLTYKLQENERWYKRDTQNKIGIIEKINEKGVCNSNDLRTELNIIYYSNVMKERQKQIKDFTVYFVAGTQQSIDILSKHNCNCLISYYYIRNKKDQKIFDDLGLKIPSILKRKNYKKIRRKYK